MDTTARDAVTAEVRRRAPGAFLDLVRERVPTLKRQGAEWRGPCPIHEGDGANFSVNPDAGVYHCHVCGAGGDVFHYVQKAYGFDFTAARAFLADRVGVRLDEPAPLYPIPQPRPKPAPKLAPTEHPALAQLRAEGVTPQLPPAVYGAVLDALTVTPEGATYLRGRGLDAEHAAAYGFRTIDGGREWDALGTALADAFLPEELEAAGLYQRREISGEDSNALVWSPPWSGRIAALVIPYKLRGECVGIRFRALDPSTTTRYRTLGGVSPVEPFNADDLHDCAGRVLHITEGELNAYCLGLAGCHVIGLPGALIWRDHWTDRLADAGQVVAWFDDDPDRQVRDKTVRGTGHEAADRLRRKLVERFGRTWVDARFSVAKLPRDADGVPLDANDYHQRGHLGRAVADVLRAS